MEKKMKIEIWSDILCPFCYIGKRNFEKALEQFPGKDQIEVIWKSYQLDPSLPEVPNDSYHDNLVKHKNMSREQVDGMLENITQTAKEAGLDYNFDKAKIVNSQKAHQLIQLAKTKGMGDKAEERLFRAFFTEGKNIADLETLIELGKDIGLDKAEIESAFTDEKYAIMVNHDIEEARQIGVQGVPFFVLNRKYAVSGAQPAPAFMEGLEKAFGEWKEQNSANDLDISQGQSCSTDGDCN